MASIILQKPHSIWNTAFRNPR